MRVWGLGVRCGEVVGWDREGWGSRVCGWGGGVMRWCALGGRIGLGVWLGFGGVCGGWGGPIGPDRVRDMHMGVCGSRAAERRVGKHGRARWAPQYLYA